MYSFPRHRATGAGLESATARGGAEAIRSEEDANELRGRGYRDGHGRSSLRERTETAFKLQEPIDELQAQTAQSLLFRVSGSSLSCGLAGSLRRWLVELNARLRYCLVTVHKSASCTVVASASWHTAKHKLKLCPPRANGSPNPSKQTT